MKSQILESESFGNGKQHYFIDFAVARNTKKYIRITRSDRQADDSYKRSSVCVFEDDFHFLIESFSLLFTSMAHRESRKVSASAAACKPTGIKSWPAEMRPREKFISAGADVLSDAELLALLIGSGTKKQNAVALASAILKSFNGDLDELSKCSLKRLAKFSGIGEARAVTMLAAMELSKRSKQQVLPFKLKAV